MLGAKVKSTPTNKIVSQERKEEAYSISIIKDGRFLLRTFDCCSWELHEVYFSKEAAQKALKELEK